MSNKTSKTLSIVLGAAFATTLAASNVANASEAGANPFAMNNLQGGYQVAKEGKCGEGKCGGEKKMEGKCGGKAMGKGKEGKCGEGKCGGDKAKKMEGKCGEGKCGGKKKMEGKCGAGDAKKMKKEGKCGEGKCGGK